MTKFTRCSTRDVLQRVSVYCDYVGVVAGFECAYFFLPAQKFGGIDGGRLNGFERGQAALGQGGQFVGVLALRSASAASKPEAIFTPRLFAMRNFFLNSLQKSRRSGALFGR